MNTLPPSSATIIPPKNRFLIALILFMISCLISSLFGLVLGQLGNLFYLMAGEAANCLVIPGFLLLFLISFALSFLINRLLSRWWVRSR